MIWWAVFRFRSRNPDRRQRAAGKLVRSKNKRLVVARLLHFLSSDDMSLRKATEECLNRVDPDWRTSEDAQAAINRLVPYLMARDPAKRAETERAAEAIDPDWPRSTVIRNNTPDPSTGKSVADWLETFRRIAEEVDHDAEWLAALAQFEDRVGAHVLHRSTGRQTREQITSAFAVASVCSIAPRARPMK